MPFTATPAFETFVTDDELVAIATQYQRPWPLPLPTVDVESADQLKISALRGMRSLLTRGGVLEGGDFQPGLARLASVVGASTTLTSYVGDREGNVVDWGFGFGAVEASDGWLVDEINALGLHRLSWADSVEEFFMGLLGGVYRHEVAVSADRALCLARAQATGAEVLVVGNGTAMHLRLGDKGNALSSVAVTDLEAAIAALLAAGQ